MDYIFDLNEEYEWQDENDDIGNASVYSRPSEDEYGDGGCNVTPNLQDLSIDDVKAMTFQTEEEAYDFYLSYARMKGFGVRKTSIRKANDGKILARLFVCSKEGERRDEWTHKPDRVREPRGESRVGCEARLRILYNNKKAAYVVAQFQDDHNHTLTAPERVMFHSSHRSINASDMAEARWMHKAEISSSKIMDYMVQKYGGYEACGFTQKDLSNALDGDYREEILDGDLEAALAYMSAKQDDDPAYYYKYKVDDQGHLEILFWSDSQSRDNYGYFDYVLAFDTTYSTNIYNRPFVMLVGVNNHYQTTMFGCALLPNEVEATYIWVLDTFLEAMKGKKPRAVITDGDKAMRGAILYVIPEAVHRLCKWHILKNVRTNIHIKGFLDDFNNLMDEPCSSDEFEASWGELLEKYDLANNSWLPRVYSTRKLWAMAYLKENFFANMRTTGRCESSNSYFNMWLNKRLRIFKFVRSFDQALLKNCHRELKEIHKSEETIPMLTTKLHEIETHAREVFTRNIFFMVRSQLELTIQIFDVQCSRNDEGEFMYYMSMYKKNEATWIVWVNASDMNMRCSCLLFESCEIPCADMFQVMKIRGMKEIPEPLIKRRWTRKAKCMTPSFQTGSLPSANEQVARYGTLSTRCNKMSYFASHTSSGFQEANEMLDKLTARVEQLYMSSVEERKEGAHESKRIFGVRDPEYVKTKGNPGKKKS